MAELAQSRSDRRAYPRTLALALLCAGVLMVILDGTIVTVALPSIADDLGFSSADLALGHEHLHDRVRRPPAAVRTPRRPVRPASGSPRRTRGVHRRVRPLRCRDEPGDAARGPVRAGRGRGDGVRGEPGHDRHAVPGAGRTGQGHRRVQLRRRGGASLGLVLGGVLTEAASWHWIFLVNLPIGVLTLLMSARILSPDTPAGPRGKADVAGAALVTAGLMLLVFAVVKAEAYGWGSAKTWLLVAGSLALLALFAVRQHLAAEPLLPLRTFRSRNATGANVLQVFTIAAMFGFQVLVVLYMQHVLGYGPAKSGWGMFPTAFAIGAVSLGLSARLIGRFGARNVLVGGLLMLTAAMAYLTPGAGGRPTRWTCCRCSSCSAAAAWCCPRSRPWRCPTPGRRTRAWCPGCSAPPSRSARRWAWPC
ncbi:MFS transporter [Yinghuangia aomiensis]